MVAVNLWWSPKIWFSRWVNCSAMRASFIWLANDARYSPLETRNLMQFALAPDPSLASLMFAPFSKTHALATKLHEGSFIPFNSDSPFSLSSLYTANCQHGGHFHNKGSQNNISVLPLSTFLWPWVPHKLDPRGVWRPYSWWGKVLYHRTIGAAFQNYYRRSWDGGYFTWDKKAHWAPFRPEGHSQQSNSNKRESFISMLSPGRKCHRG